MYYCLTCYQRSSNEVQWWDPWQSPPGLLCSSLCFVY